MIDAAGEVKRLYRLSLLAVMGLGILISVAWAWAAFNPVPLARPQMTFSSMTIGKADLCPGETLSYTYTVNILQPGIYLFDTSVWIVDPAQVVEWSNPLRMVAHHAEAVTVTRNWKLADGLYNTLSDRLEPWRPGKYERHIGLTSSGRDTLPSMAMIPFEIREGCK